jgi:hypothetical protein
MNVSDISKKETWLDKTSRRTDPMRPEYNIYGMEYKDDKYTKPTQPMNQAFDGHLLQVLARFSLRIMGD